MQATFEVDSVQILILPSGAGDYVDGSMMAALTAQHNLTKAESLS